MPGLRHTTAQAQRPRNIDAWAYETMLVWLTHHRAKLKRCTLYGVVLPAERPLQALRLPTLPQSAAERFEAKGREEAVSLLTFQRTAVLVVASLAAACAARPERCAICFMPVPRETRAVVRVDGSRELVACDARCPLTFQQQTRRRVVLVSVADYLTGESLEPARAFYVTGSDTAPDAHTQALRTTPSDAAYLHWHRCLPSVLAFRTRDEALAFRQQHGGVVTTHAELGFAGS